MTSIVRFYLAIFALSILLIADATLSFAQVDPTKALIGTWEGQVEISTNSGRTLLINSVKAKGDGEWVARGRYTFSGQAKEGPGGQEITVTSKDNEIYLDFVAGGSKNPVHLKLVGDNKLEGTSNMQDRGQSRPSDKRISFEKVAPKAGDVK